MRSEYYRKETPFNDSEPELIKEGDFMELYHQGHETYKEQNHQTMVMCHYVIAPNPEEGKEETSGDLGIATILDSCTYKPNWQLNHEIPSGGRSFIQFEVTDIDAVTGEPVTWKSGKRYLSPYMCRQEIVGVVFGLIAAAEEHERREFFKYKGKAIYNAHIDPEALAEVADKLNTRTGTSGEDKITT